MSQEKPLMLYLFGNMKLLFSTALALIFISANAQFIIKAKVVDTKGNGIEYANIIIENKSIGVSANRVGEFILKVATCSLSDSLKISCIGYHNTKVSIQDIIKKKNRTDNFSAYSYFIK